MGNPNGAVASKERPRLFSVANRVKILAAAVGEPSGVITEIGGQRFDLVPISSEQLIQVLDLVTKFSDVMGSIEKKEFTDADIFKVIGEDLGRIVDVAKDVLYRSAFLNRQPVDDADQQELEADRGVFREWFNVLPVIPMLKTLAPLVLAANGVGKDQLIPTTGPENLGPQETSTPLTPASTSSPDTDGSQI